MDVGGGGGGGGGEEIFPLTKLENHLLLWQWKLRSRRCGPRADGWTEQTGYAEGVEDGTKGRDEASYPRA